MRDYESCEKVVQQTVEKFGKLYVFPLATITSFTSNYLIIFIYIYNFSDLLLNGAAGNFLAPAEKLSSNGFRTGTPHLSSSFPIFNNRKVIEIDLLGTFNMSRAAFDALKSNPDGSLIVNITATLDRTHAHYQIHASAAKVFIRPSLISSSFSLLSFHALAAHCSIILIMLYSPSLSTLFDIEVAFLKYLTVYIREFLDNIGVGGD